MASLVGICSEVIEQLRGAKFKGIELATPLTSVSDCLPQLREALQNVRHASGTVERRRIPDGPNELLLSRLLQNMRNVQTDLSSQDQHLNTLPTRPNVDTSHGLQQDETLQVACEALHRDIDMLISSRANSLPDTDNQFHERFAGLHLNQVQIDHATASEIDHEYGDVVAYNSNIHQDDVYYINEGPCRLLRDEASANTAQI